MSATEKIPSIDRKIFKILIMCSKKEFVSINSIANELNVTTRSVRTYIKQLNKDLGNDIAVIKYIKGQGYKLEIKDEQILNKIIDMNRKNVFSLNSKEDRVEFILNYLIELDGFITLDSLADEMCVGRTTLVNDFQYVEKVLASYNLNLIKKQNTGMKLNGNELDIRLFILNQLYKNSRKDFSNSKYFKGIKKEINDILLSEKWKNMYFEALRDASGKTEDMIKMSEIYDVNLSFDDLLPYLNRDIRDFEVYWHISKKGTTSSRLKLLNFFEERFKVDDLIGKMKDIEKDKLTQEYYDDMLFFIVLKGSKSLYPEGKNISLKGIFGNINEVRKESINILKRYREKLSLEELKMVKEAYEKEKNVILKDELRRVLYESNNLKKEFVNIEKIKVDEHGKDIYLTSIAVAGSRFRNREYLEKELEKSKIYYLTREKDNLYDEKAIKIVGETGYVIGYVPRKENYILSNLLDGGKLLYCRVTEYNLYEDCIYANVYLSYKDVIETVENSLKMVLDKSKIKLIN